MLPKTTLLALVCLCGLFLILPFVNAETYYFGEGGENTDLFDDGPADGIWTTDDNFYIVGDCHIDANETITIHSGVIVIFWDQHEGDPQDYPTITVNGTLDCNGTSENEIYFTNQDGLDDRGEFKGLLINNILDAEYTVFEYGGNSTNALIRMAAGAQVTMENCTVKESDTDGITTTGNVNRLLLTDCTFQDIDNLAIDGNDQIPRFQLNNCTFKDDVKVENVTSSVGFDPYIVSCDFDGSSLTIGPTCAGLLVACNDIHSGNSEGIVIYGGVNCSPTIRNNAIYNNTNGIYLANYDNDGNPIRIYNNVIWDNNSDGLYCDDYEGRADQWNVEVINNIFGQNDDDAVDIDGGMQIDLDITSRNSFKNNGTNWEGCNFTRAYVHGAANTNFQLVDEAVAGGIDFHIDWVGYTSVQKTLVNSGDALTGNEDEDPDESDIDQGMYGGTYAELHGLDYYVRMGAGTETRKSRIRRSTYRVFDNRILAPNFDNEVVEVAAGTIFEMAGTYRLRSNGTLRINGTEDLPVTMKGYNHQSWEGLYFSSSSNTDSWVKWVEFEDADYSNCPSLKIFAANYIPGETLLIENCDFEDDPAEHGIRITNSRVKIKECWVNETDDAGIYLTTIDNDPESIVWIVGCDIRDCSDEGIKLNNASPYIGYVDAEDDIFTTIRWNVGNGINCLGSSCPIMRPAAGEGINSGYVLVESNFDDQLKLDDNARPILINGHNALFFNDGEDFDNYTIDMDGGSDLEVDWNYWATDPRPDPDGHYDDIFNCRGDGDVVVDDWENWDEEREYPDNIEDFFVGLNYMSTPGSEALAIPYFERCILDDQSGMYAIAALTYLRGNYICAGADLDDLQSFYDRVIESLPESELSKIAANESIWCLYDQRDVDGAVIGFEEIIQNAESRTDSLRAEMDRLLVLAFAGREGEVVDCISPECMAMGDPFDAQFDMLSDMLEDELDRENIPKPMIGIPVNFQLLSPYPNPFNSSTHIAFSLDNDAVVSISAYDMTGRKLTNLISGNFKAGSHEILWNAENVASGAYNVRLTVDGMSKTAKLMLIR